MLLTDEQVSLAKAAASSGVEITADFLKAILADREALVADREALVAEIEQHHAKATCMCGSYMSEHTGWEGHIGVSMYDYALDKSQERVRELETKIEKLRRVVETVRKLRPILRLITVRQVINAGDAAIDAVGLNPWCMNEGLAGGDEPINLYWLDAALEPREVSDAQDKADDA